MSVLPFSHKAVEWADEKGEMVRRVDVLDDRMTALTAGEPHPTLAVLFAAGLTNAQRNAAMMAIAKVPGVVVVETMELYNEIVAIEAEDA